MEIRDTIITHECHLQHILLTPRQDEAREYIHPVLNKAYGIFSYFPSPRESVNHTQQGHTQSADNIKMSET